MSKASAFCLHTLIYLGILGLSSILKSFETEIKKQRDAFLDIYQNLGWSAFKVIKLLS